MRALRFRPSALKDIRAIVDYIAWSSSSSLVARRFERQLRAECARLAELPGTLGTARPELGPRIRSLAFKYYLIFFVYEPGRVRSSA